MLEALDPECESGDTDGPAQPAGDLEGADATESGEISEFADASEPRRGHDAGSADEPCPGVPLTQRIEAILLCSDRPLTDAKIATILGLGSDSASDRKSSNAAARIHEAVEELNRSYAATGRAFRIEAVVGGRQILTLPSLGPLMARLRAVRGEGRLSAAALETLAIVAYRQPILRADIESIRGVACGEVLRTLMERRLVRIVGRAEELGRPMLYGTTREFLRVFGLAKIEELPKTGESLA